MSPEEAHRVLEELRVHQIELEMQNEELRRTQMELDVSRARYFDLYDLAPVGYCTVDAKGLIQEANLTSSNLLGIDRGAMMKLPFSKFVFPQDQDIHYRNLKLLGETTNQSFELRMVRQDGSMFWAHIAMTSEPGSDGEPVCRIVIVDITRQKLLEDELRHSQKLESLGVLAGGVAHEMNNVLGAILSLSSINLGIQPQDSPAYRAFDIINQAATRGKETVKGLLNFARKKPESEEVLDLNAILIETTRLLEHLTLARIRTEIDLAPGLQPVRGDASALSSAFMNLCVNAIDAMPHQGTLTLRTRNVDKNWIEVSVEDTGIGMSPEVVAKAMDPFFSTKEVGKGTGLGLSTTAGIVKYHRGVLEIQSKPGDGTRIRIRFPVCEVAEQLRNPETKAASELSTPALAVLVVDDDVQMQDAMREILRLSGHSFYAALSGEEAVAKMEAGFQPDVIVLDLNMPGLGGAKTLPLLRARQPNVPIILSTGRDEGVVHPLVAAHPGVTILPKPYEISELLQALRNSQMNNGEHRES